MHVKDALIIYAIIVVVVYVLARGFFGLHGVSALALAILSGLLGLSLACPYSSIEKVIGKSELFGTYSFVMTISTFYLLFYIIYNAVYDRDPGRKTFWECKKMKNVKFCPQLECIRYF